MLVSLIVGALLFAVGMLFGLFLAALMVAANRQPPRIEEMSNDRE